LDPRGGFDTTSKAIGPDIDSKSQKKKGLLGFAQKCEVIFAEALTMTADWDQVFTGAKKRII
jgi:hypothetical protein